MTEDELLVEKVAAAIVAYLRSYGDVVYVADKARRENRLQIEGDFDFDGVARAAIEAMRK